MLIFEKTNLTVEHQRMAEDAGLWEQVLTILNIDDGTRSEDSALFRWVDSLPDATCEESLG
jgi:hypothetical protein